eukprot:3841691-Pyramimonas_sp.AAC.1
MRSSTLCSAALARTFSLRRPRRRKMRRGSNTSARARQQRTGNARKGSKCRPASQQIHKMR